MPTDGDTLVQSHNASMLRYECERLPALDVSGRVTHDSVLVALSLTGFVRLAETQSL